MREHGKKAIMLHVRNKEQDREIDWRETLHEKGSMRRERERARARMKGGGIAVIPQ